MKLKWLVVLVVVCGMIAMAVWWTSVSASQPPAATPFLALSRVPVPEMPAKAADLVATAPVLERPAVAAAVLQAVNTMTRPGVMPYVVSAICRHTPDVTETVVATAIKLQPDNELPFCRAAVCAAPDRVGEVVAAACRPAPSSFANAALVAFDASPSAGALILYSITNALPAVKPFMDRAAQTTSTNSFEALIRQTVQLLTEAAKAQKAGQNQSGAPATNARNEN